MTNQELEEWREHSQSTLNKTEEGLSGSAYDAHRKIVALIDEIERRHQAHTRGANITMRALHERDLLIEERNKLCGDLDSALKKLGMCTCERARQPLEGK